MTIQDWGAIGEMLGALGVILTLVYLARQIRMSARTQRAQTHQQLADGRRDALRMFFEFPELARAVDKASGQETPSDEEEALLRRFTVMTTRAYENELYLHSLGMVSDEELAVQRRLLTLPHMRLDRMREEMFTPAMQSEIRALREEILAMRGRSRG